MPRPCGPRLHNAAPMKYDLLSRVLATTALLSVSACVAPQGSGARSPLLAGSAPAAAAVPAAPVPAPAAAPAPVSAGSSRVAPGSTAAVAPAPGAVGARPPVRADASSVASAPAAVPGPVLTYAAVLKIIGDARGHVPTVRSRLLGRQVRLTLKAPGPQSLVVDVADEIFFACDVRGPRFKGGRIQAMITGYGETESGHGPMIRLDRCP